MLGDSKPLTIHLDTECMAVVTQAAELRGLSIGDYVQAVLLPQARREVEAADEQVHPLTPKEQRAFGDPLEGPPLTDAQQRLGRLMRGEE